MSFLAELKRRNVVRVGIAYIVAAWLLLQLTEVLTELLEIGPEVGKIVIVLLLVGFVPAVIFAWAFELTPDGVKRDSEVDRSSSVARQTGQKLNVAIIAMLVMVAGYFIWESRFKAPAAQDVAKSEQPVDGQSAAETERMAPSESGAAETAGEKSIVVLPFINMSADDSQEYFSDGLSEEILNALVPIENLRVISRTSAFAFKGKDLSVPQIAEQLGVSHVLEGSVRTAGDDLRITAQLIEVSTDSHLWSQAYNRKMDNVFEVQEEISRAIAGQLQMRLSEQNQVEQPTDNVEAYTLYLRGRHIYQKRGADNMRMAADMFTQAVDLDPDFDKAWANLAAARMISAFYRDAPPGAMLAAPESDARRAIALNPDNGLAHGVLGMLAFSRFEFEDALKQMDQAIALDPNDSNPYLWKAIVLNGLGYVDEAIATLKTAERFDPAFSNLHNWLVSSYLNKGDIERARHHEQQARTIDPSYAYQNNDPGEIALLQGDLETYASQIQFSLSPYPELEPQWRALVAAIVDPGVTAETVRVLQNDSNDGPVWGDWAAFWRLGEVELALNSFREQVAEGRALRSANSLGVLWRSYDRDNLSSPALAAFFEEYGIADYWREHGDPDYCRALGDNFECETP